MATLKQSLRMHAHLNCATAHGRFNTLLHQCVYYSAERKHGSNVSEVLFGKERLSSPKWE